MLKILNGLRFSSNEIVMLEKTSKNTLVFFFPILELPKVYFCKDEQYVHMLWGLSVNLFY